MKVLEVAVLLLFILSVSTVTAQESINTTGGNASGSGGSLSFSVGQFAYQTHTGANGSVAEGVQQAFEISEVSAIEETNGIILLVSAYPNPTTDYLTLSINEFDISNLKCQVYDINGKLLQIEKITGAKTQISMCNYAPSSYFVKVMQGNKEVKTFKVIKK